VLVKQLPSLVKIGPLYFRWQIYPLKPQSRETVYNTETLVFNLKSHWTQKHNLLSMHKLLSNKTTKHKFLNHSKHIQQKLESMQIICCHHNRRRGKCWNLSQILEHMFCQYSLPQTMMESITVYRNFWERPLPEMQGVLERWCCFCDRVSNPRVGLNTALQIRGKTVCLS